jgi:hypothetical protein
MKTRIDYLIKDNQCEKAIEDFKTLTSVTQWIDQYSVLFDSISIKPESFPRITSSHFDGESFENIQKFAQLYEMVNSLFEK